MVQCPSLESIRKAADGLKDIVLKTPLVPFRSAEGPRNLLLKPEIHQAVTSFKIRGVFHAVASLDPDKRKHGLSTVSAGNTAQALAWAGRYFGVHARSLMPDIAPRTKIEAVKKLGGTPVLVPIEELFHYMKEKKWTDEPYCYICPWTNPWVHTGHGSLGLEIAEQAPDVESVFIPVGGGGLLVGVASAIKALLPKVKIIAVEPTGCPSLHLSLEANRPMAVERSDTFCDGVAVPYMTDEMFPLLKRLVDDIVLVSDEDTRAQVRRLAFDNKMIVEGSGALAVAAALNTPEEARGKSVALLTGGSLDPEKLIAILSSE